MNAMLLAKLLNGTGVSRILFVVPREREGQSSGNNMSPLSI